MAEIRTELGTCDISVSETVAYDTFMQQFWHRCRGSTLGEWIFRHDVRCPRCFERIPENVQMVIKLHAPDV